MALRPRELTIAATDGWPLAATLFRPSPGGALDRTVIVSPATGVWRTFYRPFAAFLSEQGFRVLTYDYRGIGDSRGPDERFSEHRMRHWGERDMVAVIDWVRRRRDGPLLTVGHSAGTQLLGLCPNNRHVHAHLGIAVGSGYWRHWSPPRRWLLAALWYLLLPAASRMLGRFPGRALGFGTDLPPNVALEWASWCRNPGYLVGDLETQTALHFRDYEGALRILSFTDDPYAPPQAVKALLSFYPSARRDHIEIHPRDRGFEAIGHMGFFRESPGSDLWPDAAAWLAEI